MSPRAAAAPDGAATAQRAAPDLGGTEFRRVERDGGLAWIAGGAVLLVALLLLAALPGWSGEALRALGAAESIVAWKPSSAQGLFAWPGMAGLARIWEVGGPGDGWLTSAWTCASRLLWSGLFGSADGGVAERAGPALAYRCEQIALLVLAALCLAPLARRALSPWFGREHARAAGACAALLLLAHPLAWVASTGLESRGPLLALCAELAALWVLLRGRQERREGAWIGAALLAVIAGAAHAQAWTLPFAAALLEFASARRYRPVLVRARSAATTLVLAAACVGFEPLLRFLLLPRSHAQPVRAWLGALGDPAHWLDAPGRFAWSLLPVNLAGASVVAGLLAGALWLSALQPALLASRHAPRLWGGTLLAAALALAVGVLVIGPESASSDDLRRAWAHLATLPAAVITLGLGATALSGRARVAACALCIALCAALSAADLRAYPGALREADVLGAALERARTLYGAEARILVIDPPRVHGGLACSGDTLGALLDPQRGNSPRVDGPVSPAFLAYVRSGGFEAARRVQPLVALVRAGALGRGGSEWQTLAFQVRAPDPRGGPIVWRGDGRSPDLAVDPMRYGRLRVEPAAPPVERNAALSWRAANDAVGVGRSTAAANGGNWTFDLSESLAWRLSGEVRRVWLEGPLVRMKEAVLELDAPLALPARHVGEQLVIDGLALPIEPSARGTVAFQVEVLDAERLELASFAAVPAPLGAELSARVGRTALARAGGAWLAWSDSAGVTRRARLELAD